jgi:predicted nucleotidyltransferase
MIDSVYSEFSRERLLRDLVDHARTDPSVVAAALVGSAARGQSDRWSDIDLALRLAPGEEVHPVATNWTTWVSAKVRVVDTLDVEAAGALYRVFLTGDTLQIDLSFFPYEAFRATNGECMRVLFGEALAADPTVEHDWRSTARTGWLYLLHARAAIARERLWQAELMLADSRAVVLSLAAQRIGLRRDHGREAHLLPADITDALADARAPRLTVRELTQSLDRTIVCFLAEVGRWDRTYRDQLTATLHGLVGSIASPGGRTG